MKKIAVTLLTIFSLFIISCEIGLGASVDTDPPSIDIVTPQVDTIIRDNFAIGGTWSDDGTIASIIVKLERTDGYGSPIDNLIADFTLPEKGEIEGNWSYIIKPVEDNIIDGPYQATVTITDTTGRKTIQTRTFTIDNTAPIVVLQRPSSVIGSTDSDTDTYGQILSLVGQAADDNNINTIEVNFYSDEACTNLLDTVTLSNIPATINLDLAKFVENSDNDYSKIYGHTGKSGTETRYCKIIAYDGAQKYPADGSNQTAEDTRGNKQEIYYLYDDISADILSYHKITDLYSMFNGTYAFTAADRSAEDVDINAIKSALTAKENTKGKFNLNPANNPTFLLSGRPGLKKDGTDFYSASNPVTDNNITTDSTAIVEVSPGLDGISLNGDSLKVYIVECNEFGTALDDVRFYPPSTKSKSGTGYKFVSTITNQFLSADGSKKLTLGKYYLFGVEGTDQKNNPVVPNIAGGYGFYFAASGAAPRLETKLECSADGVTWTEIKDQLSYLPAGTKVKISGKVIVENGMPDFTLKLDSTDAGISFTEKTEAPFEYSFEKIYEPSAFGTESAQHTINITAIQTGGKTEKAYTIMYDVAGPVVTLSDISPVAYKYLGENGTKEKESDDANAVDKKYLNGSNVSIKISIADAYDIVDSTKNKAKIEIFEGTNITEGAVAKQSVTGITTPSNFIWENIDTTGITNGEITIRVTAWDRAGNETVWENTSAETPVRYFVNQTTDNPVILPSNASELSFAISNQNSMGSKNKFTSGGQLLLKLIDDDGLASITPYEGSASDSLTQKNTVSLDTTTKETLYSYYLPTQAGYHYLKFVLRDSIGNSTTIEPFVIKISAGAPSVTEINSVVKNKDGQEKATSYTKGEQGTNADYFENTIKFASEYSSVYVYRSTDGVHFETLKDSNGDEIVVSCTPSTAESYEYKDKVYPGVDTTYHYYFAGIDGTDRVQGNSQKVTCKVDKVMPSLVELKGLPGKEDTRATQYTFTGTARDEGGSGIDKVFITISNGTNSKTVEAEGSTSWSYDLDYKDTTGDPSWMSIFGSQQGYKSIYIKAVDAAGNESSEFKFDTTNYNNTSNILSFLYDYNIPVLSFNKEIDEFMSSEGFTFEGTASDTYSVAKLEVTQVYTPATGDAVSASYTIFTIPENETNVSKTWTCKVPLNNAAPAEGKYTYTFNLTDKKGNIISKGPFETTVDKNAPTVTITSPAADTEFKGEDSISDNLFQFEGEITETNSMSGVYYKIVASNADGTASTTEPAHPATGSTDVTKEATWTGAGFTKVSSFGTTSWKARQNFHANGTQNPAATSLGEGKNYKLYVYGVDKAGNVSTAATRIFDVDMSKPVTTATSGKTLYKKSDLNSESNAGSFTVEGNASDSNGLASLQLSYVSEANSTPTSLAAFTLPLTNDRWSQTFRYGNGATGTSTEPKLADGIYTFTVTATDKVGKTNKAERKITVDTNPPEIKDNTLKIDDVSFDSTKWYESKTLPISIEVSDGTGSGIAKVQVTATENAADDDRRSLSLLEGLWTGTVQFDGEDGSNNFWIRAKDNAGNDPTVSSFTVKIDTSAPKIDLIKYYVGSVESEKSGTVYINDDATKTLTLYGSYSDTNSGVKALSFKGCNSQPEIWYSTEEISGTKTIETITWSKTLPSVTSNVKYWKAEFANSALKTGDLSVTGRNNAGKNGLSTEIVLFNIAKDRVKPTLNNITLMTDSTKYSVYKNGDTYYINNTEGKFIISGLAEDKAGKPQGAAESDPEDPASGVAAVTLNISGLAADKQPAPSKTAYFSNIDLSSLSGSTTATLVVTDKAGNETTPLTMEIVFDTAGPVGKHEIDTKGKDLYFRFGDADNDTVNDTKDSDVGGKYSPLTYGKLNTLKVRGTFEDKVSTAENAAAGSGVSLIYYKIFRAEPADDELDDFKANCKTDNNGFFSPLKENETKRVYYNSDANNKEITSTYKTTLADLEEGLNYVVFAAVDNVGNIELDTADYNGTAYSDYKINVDQTLPEITADETDTISTNATGSEIITGTYVDAASWLKVMSVKIGNSTIPATTTADTITIPASAITTNATTGLSTIESNDLKFAKFNYLVKDDDTHKYARIKIGDSYYDIMNTDEPETTGKISFTPAFTAPVPAQTSYTVELGSGTWSATIPAATLQAYNGKTVTVSATATDNAQNTQTEPVISTIIVDRKFPKVEIESLNTTINGTVPLKINASDNNGITQIKLQYKKSTDSTWSTYATLENSESVTITNPYTWDIDVVTTDTSKFGTDGDGNLFNFRAIATDLAGNEGNSENSLPGAATLDSRTKNTTISQDSDRPVIKFRDLTLPSASGGIIPCPLDELSFTISDDDGSITADEVAYQFTAITASTPDSTKWIDKNSQENKLTYENGLFTLKEITDGEKYIWFKIVDKANTTFTSDATSTTNLKAPKVTGSNDVVYSVNTALHLKVDTNPPSVARTSYLPVTGAASYTLTDWKEKSAVTPVFGGPDAKKMNTFRVSLYAYDANTVNSVKLTIPQEAGDKNTAVYEYTFDKATAATLGLSATDTTIDENTYNLWLSPEINVKDFATSVRTCKITVTEGVNPKNIDFNINIDNDAPHLQGTITPEANEPVVGTVKVRGEVADNEKGIGVYAAGLKYYIPKSSETTPSESTGWISLGDGAGTSTWKIEISNLNNTIGYNNDSETVSGDYSSYGSGLDGLYLLPVWFRLEDTYGNIDYDTTKVKILYNPNADKPTVRITDPVHDTPEEAPAYVIAGGKLKISGTASDNIGISAVYLQFDMDGNGTYENGAGVTGAPSLTLENIPNKKDGNTQLQGVKAKGTESWSCEVNLMNLEDLNTASKHLKIRAIAIDKGHSTGNDLYSAWSTVLEVYVDNIKPQFSTPELRRYDSAITEANAAANADSYNARKDYKKDMYIRTKKSATEDLYWYIYGEALVKTGNYITELNVSSSDAEGIWKGSAGNKTERSGDIFTWSEDDGLTHKYLIPVVRSNRDAWETTLTAKGNNFNDNKNENEYVFNINIDNDAPSFSDTNSTNANTLGDIKLYKNTYGGSTFEAASTGEKTLKNEDGFVTIAGKVAETGSGFARLAFYFVRKDKDNANIKRVYNIMEPHTSGTNIRTNNRTDIVASQSAGSVNLNEENLPALYVTGATRSSETTISAAAINGNKNIRVGGLVKIGGEYRNITKVQGNEVTFDSNCPTSFKTAEFIYAMVVDHTGESFNNDKTAIVDDDYEGTDAYSKGDGMLEKYKSEGDDYEWEATINSKSIPDGPIEIHCVVFDKAGNVKSGWTKTYVSNNPPRLTSVMLGTDLNSDGNYTLGENNEFRQYWVNTTTSNGVVSHDTTKGTTNAWWSIDAFLPDSTDYWTAKKDLVVIPEFVGGTGDVYYKYTKATGSNGEKLQAAQQLTRNNAGTITDGAVLLASDSHILAADGSQIALTASHIENAIGAIILKNDDNANSDGLGKISTVTGDYSKGTNDGINVYRFSFWDSTEECTAGTDSQWTVLNVTLKQDLTDNTPPVGTITPFYWRKENGQIKSSLVYDAGNVAQGHIELENDWINSDYYKGLEESARTGEFDADPKVSGKIRIEGNASDETMLKTIKVTFDNKSVTATYNPYAKTENGVTIPKGWSYATNTADFTLEITDANGPTQEGHSVTWVYTVDTSKASAVAAVNSVIKVEVADTSSVNSGAGNSNTVGNNSTSASALTAYYKVDVVPYITGIKTELSAGSNKRPTVLSRSALGVYPVRRGSNITVEGFNLNGTNSRVLVDATEYTPTTGTATNSLVITTDANTTSKGVVAKTGTVTSLNNLTLKTVEYNKEGNGQNNDILTDKRELKVVDVTTTTDTTDKRMLDMVIYNNTINFASGCGPDNYATMMNATGTGIGTVRNIRNSYTRYFDGAMAINSQGTPFTVSACGDSYGPVTSWNSGPSHFALTRGSTAASNLQEYRGANGTSLLYLESNWNGADLNNLDRFKWPDIVVTGNDANTKGYISYYDSSLKVIKFRYFETDGSKVATNYDVYTAGNTPQAMNQYNNTAIKRQSTEGTVRNDLTSNQGYMVIAGANENSQYSSVGVTSAGAAVVAWYDATNGELKMKYNTSPATSYSGYQTITGFPSEGTISFNIAVDGAAAKPVSFTYSYVSGETDRANTRNVHELAYKLNEVLSNGYGAYAEVDPSSTSYTIAVRSMQTGTGSSISITNFSSTGTNKGIVGTAVAGAGQPWTLVTIDEESAGQFVSMKTDSKGGIHFAYYDTGNGDLKYAYIADYTSVIKEDGTTDKSKIKVVTVDGYQQVGQYVDLALKETTDDTNTYVTPYISYYSMSNADTKRAAKVAKLASPIVYTGSTSDSSTVLSGSDDELFTGNWEAMHIPTYGIPVQYRVNIGVTSGGNVYISYLADRTIEYVKVE